MADFEKLGVFYLGREYDPAAKKPGDELILYDSKDLTTHAVCVGMTGSGKTGLCIALLEEAAIDGIPAIAIDPKGDLGNLLLTFPNLAPADFRPWIDTAEAARQNVSPDDYAAKVASTWRDGLAQWGEEPARIARLRESADVAIYTPGSNAGLPLSVLQSFAPPTGAEASDPAALRDRISAVASGLLGLLGIDADPLKSREHILIANILDKTWTAGRALDVPALIGAIQKPPFDKVGVFDLETFFPAKDRTGLAMSVNNLLASPGFSAWMEGEPLDVQRLLFTPEGKPRISILSIAHLSDPERMFFVTLLLNELIAWMRNQTGTSSLRALLYMDEIFGYFPPTAMPPSKLPMLTLLKQARAFGLGVVLSTQNPVDLDYKGLSNAGTWLIGRLQTERDKQRVIEGLESALGGEGFDRSTIDKLISNLTGRVFLMRNVHDDAPVLFQSRWALSYLRGPLTLTEIQTLMESRRKRAAPASQAAAQPAAASTAPSTRQALPAEVNESFLKPLAGEGGALLYKPMVAGLARLHYVDSKAGVDIWTEAAYVAPFADDGRDALWEEATVIEDFKSRVDKEPQAGARYAELPAAAVRPSSYAQWAKSLEDHLYQHAKLTIYACDQPKVGSKAGETEGDFRTRLSQALREQRDAMVEKLRSKYAPRVQSLQDQLQRSHDRVAREQAQYSQQKLSSAISIGATILGALFGSRRVSAGTVGRAATAARSAGRIGREHEDVERANESEEVLQQRLAALNAECEQEVTSLQAAIDPQTIPVRAVTLSARKSDIAVGRVALLWAPWREDSEGMPRPAFKTGG
jgi:hypothetical protein